MSWDQLLLERLRQSRPTWDEPPEWRAALSLYEGLSASDTAALDRAVAAMIDEAYKNPYASREELPFDEVMVNLPAGMSPDDLLCIEAAALVAAERGLGDAYFPFNRLLRSPRWHAMSPRFLWLARESLEVQRKLATSRAGRYMGAMLGLAAGDALGATLEFQSRRRIRESYPDGFREIVGGGPFRIAPGEWTDDTAMALAVARGIAESPDDPVEAVGRHFMAWYDSCPPDVGNTCRLALDAFRKSGSWAAASGVVREQLGDQAGGNGALMRTLPTALAYASDVSHALAIARMTHPHPESDAAVAIYQKIVASLLDGASKDSAIAAGMSAAGPLCGRLAGLDSLTEERVRASGYGVDTLEAALWCFVTTTSLEECLVRAVNLGEDTDTVGAVAGGLCGAHYGPLAVPRRWSTALLGRGQLEEATEALYQVSCRQDAQR